ncbi:hypothetical protein M408DRAFT_331603, partial [Serendipita vermifera MAFF 305830]
MLKQLLLQFLAFGEPQYDRRDYASLTIQTPLKPLLATCASTRHTTRDDYVCREAEEVGRYGREQVVSLDIMPDVCGVPKTASSDCIDSWETITEWWGHSGYNLFELLRETILGDGAAWKDVVVTGDWMQVKKTLDCLGNIEPAHTNTTTLSINVKRPRNCSSPYDYVDVYIPTKAD